MDRIENTCLGQGQTASASVRHSSLRLRNQGGSAPAGNTGVSAAQNLVGLGWLTLVFKADNVDRVLPLVLRIRKTVKSSFHDKVDSKRHGLNSYQHRYVFSSESSLQWSPDRLDICLTLTQRLFDKLTLKALAQALYNLVAIGPCKATRLDVYVDNFDGSLQLENVLAALKSGDFSSRCRQWSHIYERDRKDLLGETIYVGSRKSDSFFRFYNKELESEGKIKSIRMEYQSRDEVANTLFFTFLFTDNKNWAELLFSLLLDRIDFRQRKHRKDIKRGPRLPWWKRFVDNLDNFRWNVIRSTPRLDSALGWFESHLSTLLGSLTCLLTTDGFVDYIQAVARLGRQRMLPRHYNRLSEFIDHMQLQGVA